MVADAEECDAMSDGRDNRWNDEADDEVEGAGRGRVPDFVRKAFLTGLGAVFTTEEGVRTAVGENMKLPKEAMQYIVGQVDRTKRDLIQTLARELRTFLDGLEVDDLARRALSGTTFEIHTTIRVVADESGKLDVKNSELSLRRKKDEIDKIAEDESGDDDDDTKAKAKAAKKAKRTATKRKTSSKSSKAEDSKD